jgi:hypothetical protein
MIFFFLPRIKDNGKNMRMQISNIIFDHPSRFFESHMYKIGTIYNRKQTFM